MHFYWTFGGKVGLDASLPTQNGKLLINPPKMLIFLVATVFIWFSIIVYFLQFNSYNSEYTIYMGWFLSIIFVSRAIGDFRAVGFFKKIGSTKFSKYDSNYFSPLSLFIGSAIGVITYNAQWPIKYHVVKQLV